MPRPEQEPEVSLRDQLDAIAAQHAAELPEFLAESTRTYDRIAREGQIVVDGLNRHAKEVEDSADNKIPPTDTMNWDDIF